GRAAAGDIPWKEDVFEQISVDANIQDVLRTVIRRNGQGVIFRPGVEGEVTFEFINMPLQAAFNKLIEENGLDFSFDEATSMVTIFPFQEMKRSRLFITPRFMSLEEVKSATKRFHMDREADMIFDAESGSILLSGSPEAVRDVGGLIRDLDSGAEKRQQARLLKQRYRAENRVIENSLMVPELKVIPLRFASVGATTMTFMGESVTVPGIDDTLSNLLGVELNLIASRGDGEAKNGAELPDSSATISVDQRTNSVIVRGSVEKIAEIEEVVAQLDRPLPMVEVEVIVVEANDDASETIGARWAMATDGGDVDAGINSGIAKSVTEQLLGAGSVTQATDITTTLGELSASADFARIVPQSVGSRGVVGSFVYGATDDFLQLMLTLLEEEGKAQTIASPRVVTLNNITARVTKTDTVNVQITNNASGDVDFKGISAGLSLDITPSVIPDEKSGDLSLVRLTLNVSSSTLTASGSNPATTNDEMQTQVIIPDGATFMLGGLFKDVRRESEGGIPGLRNLPIVGNLFGTQTSADNMKETIFFITPRIVTQQELLNSQGLATRRFMQNRRQDMSEIRRDLREGSQLLDIAQRNIADLEEDE
ncbi:MAG: hypothetical protein HN344_06765, partial [Gammaproteobacteria bacterium]|nr:hypothetical protein [Gammaproteobacteria bacterium]